MEVVILSVIGAVIAAMAVAVGGWFFRDKLGWFKPSAETPEPGEIEAENQSAIAQDRGAAATSGGLAVSGKARDVTVNLGGVDAEARADIAAVKGQLAELQTQWAAQQGQASTDTDALAEEATAKTKRLLAEAVGLQRQHREREAIERLLTAYDMDMPPRAKAQLRILAGNGYLRLSDLQLADENYREALRAATSAGDLGSVSSALGNLGVVYRERGDLVRAEEYNKKALANHRSVGNRSGEAAQLSNLGSLSRNRGDLSGARKHHELALAINQELGNQVGAASDLANLGIVHAQEGNWGLAEECLLQALVVHREAGDKLAEAIDLSNLGTVYLDQDQLSRAEERYVPALTMYREVGYRSGEASTLGNIALVASKRNRKEEACRLLRQAAAIFDEIGARGVNPDNVRASLRELGCSED